jgi:hypothetical protein
MLSFCLVSPDGGHGEPVDTPSNLCTIIPVKFFIVVVV